MDLQEKLLMQDIKDTQVEHISTALDKLKIALVCGGGIAAIQMPLLARALRRHGADVHFYVTQSCLNFVGQTSLEWASQNPVTLNPTGLAEHISTHDAVVICPATADIISKSAHGLCTDGATTLIQSAFGHGIPVIFCPTMHNSLFNAPIIQQNIKKLEQMEFVEFISARKEEGKQKIPDPTDLALTVCHLINKKRHKLNQSILVTFGGTQSMIDSVRCLTNNSTGKLGFEIATQLYIHGFKVHALYARTNFELKNLEFMEQTKLENYDEFYEFMKNIDPNKYSGLFHFLAGSDYIFENNTQSKIKSDKEELELKFTKVQKIIALENIQKIKFKCCGKLTDFYDDETKFTVQSFIKKNHLNFCFWNIVETSLKNPKKHFVKVMDHNGSTLNTLLGKNNIAKECVKLFETYSIL